MGRSVTGAATRGLPAPAAEPPRPWGRWRTAGVLAGLVVVLVAVVVVSLGIGRYGLGIPQVVRTVWDVLTGGAAARTSQEAAVLFAVRIPRLLMAVLVGAALAASGAAYQGLFRNPMVSPDLLGVSSGASVGACVAMLLALPSAGIQLLSFVSGLLAVGLVMAIGSAVGRHSGGGLLILVLAGIVISSLCSAFTSLIKYLAPVETTLPEITFWLMGSFAKTGSWQNVAVLAGSLLVGAVPLMLLRWRINVLSFGDEEARALGVDTGRVRLVIILCATLLTATAVALCGVVGWVGLVIPHMCRFLVGPSYLALLPCSMLAGGTFMLVVDDVARTATAGEIPLGVLTAIIGAPVFVYLLFSGKRTWVA